MFKKIKQILRVDKTVDTLTRLTDKLSRLLDNLNRTTETLKGFQQELGELSTLVVSATSAERKIGTHLTQSGYYGDALKAKRSVLFLNNSYYHFYYLAQALRRRGWDVLTVSLENPENNSHLYYHGEDINLFDQNPAALKLSIERLLAQAKSRYKLLHFSNDHVMSFFPSNYPDADPPDIVEWKEQGNKVAYTVSGCLSAIGQSSFAKWSAVGLGDPICNLCPWQARPDVCSDERNLGWGRKVEKYCDVTFSETLPALDYLAGPKVIREPATMCMDPLIWHPELEIPEEFRLERKPGEIIVYHAVGNYEQRLHKGRNIKGTHAVLEAIERLQAEGFPVRLVFVTNQRNKDVRFTQAQADIVVDQLNIGRYGANAREAMMLGKPTICYINHHEPEQEDQLQSLREVPLVSATEETLYDVLKALVLDPEKRQELGRLSRAYTLKWHSADACAERYEQIYDQLMADQPLTHPESWHYWDPVRLTTEFTPVLSKEAPLVV